MDAPCKIQGSIHVFRLVNNMCPGKWVHIRSQSVSSILKFEKRELATKPFMPHFDINYIISKQGKESKDSFPYFIYK